MRNAVPAFLTLKSATDEIIIRAARYVKDGAWVGKDVTAADPVLCTRWDLGSPNTRDVVTDRPLADGTIDTTAFTGSRTVQLDLVIMGGREPDGDEFPAYTWAERLAAMTHPGVRPKLIIRRSAPGTLEHAWEMELRGTPYSLAYGRRAASLLEMQLTFVAPLGYLLSEWMSLETLPSTAVPAPGFLFPAVFPEYGAGTTTGTIPVITATVGGSAPVHPRVYIYGPCIDPYVRTDDGEEFAFTGLTLNTSAHIQIDMATATVRHNSLPSHSMYHVVDFNRSTFWRWKPGVHTVRYYATGGKAVVQWQDRRYSI